MQILMVASLYISLFLFITLFINKTSKIAYMLYNNKTSNAQEDSNRLFNIYKYVSYIIDIGFVISAILIAPNIRLNGWIFIFYIFWLCSLGFVKLNVSLIEHLFNVLYIKENLIKIEKEYLIGGIVIEGNKCYFTYRLTLSKIYI